MGAAAPTACCGKADGVGAGDVEDRKEIGVDVTDEAPTPRRVPSLTEGEPLVTSEACTAGVVPAAAAEALDRDKAAELRPQEQPPAEPPEQADLPRERPRLSFLERKPSWSELSWRELCAPAPPETLGEASGELSGGPWVDAVRAAVTFEGATANWAELPEFVGEAGPVTQVLQHLKDSGYEQHEAALLSLKAKMETSRAAQADVFLWRTSRSGKSWDLLLRGALVVDVHDGQATGVWCECIQAAVNFEAENPNWSSLPGYARTSPVEQVRIFARACGLPGSFLEALQRTAEQSRKRLQSPGGRLHPPPLELSHSISRGGAEIPDSIEVCLEPGQSLVANHGALVTTKEQDVAIEQLTLPGAPKGLSLAKVENTGSHTRTLQFTAPRPGNIWAVNVGELPGALLCPAGAFLCGVKDTRVTATSAGKKGGLRKGSTELPLQRLEADGSVFLFYSGGVPQRKDLTPEAESKIDAACIAAVTEGARFDVERASGGGLRNALFGGGDGPLSATLGGPGAAWLP